MLKSGDVVGKFRLEALAGSGGGADVWKAWDEALGRRVALKFLRNADRDDVARFEREARTAAKLNHPNIAAVYEVGQHDDRPFIAMLYVDGTTLGDAARDVRTTVSLLREAALAVQYAHEQGIIHRDLKPANIMVEGPRVYVMDFGLARRPDAASSVSVSGTILGTPNYMSPEQARADAAHVGPRSDVYSLGATLYELLTDRLPHASENVYATLRMVAEEEPAPPRTVNPAIPKDLETIVLKCMEKEPSRRYASVRELAEDLRRWLAGEPILAAPASSLYRLRRFAVRHALLLAIVLAGASACTILGVRWWREASRRTEHEHAAVREREARDKARPFMESGRRRLEQMRVVRTREYAPATIVGLAAEAEREFAAALQIVPRDADALLGIAAARAMAKDTPGALAVLAQAIEASPSFATAYLDRVRLKLAAYESAVHRSSGEPDVGAPARALRAELEADLAQVNRHAREMSEKKYAEGLLAFCAGDYRRAADVLAEYLKVAPIDGDARYWRGHSLYHLRETTASIAELEEAIRCDARHVEALCNLGNAMTVRAEDLTEEGKTAEAEVLFRRALATLDRAIAIEAVSSAFNNRGNAKRSLGDVQGALADYRRSLELEPGVGESWFNIALVLQSQSDRAGAIHAWSQGLMLTPKASNAYASRGALKYLDGDVAGAIRDFDEALRLDPRNAPAACHRAGAHLKNGDVAAALRDYDRAIAAAPRMVQLWRLRGEARAMAQDLDGALADFTEAIAIGADLAPSYALRGWLQRLRGENDAALSDFEKSIAAGSLDPMVHANCGFSRTERSRQLARAGREEEARAERARAIAELERALQVAPRDWRDSATVVEVLRQLREKK